MEKQTLNVSKQNLLEALGSEELPEVYEQYIGIYKLQSWSYGQRQKIVSDANVIIVDDKGNSTTDVDPFKYSIGILSACIIQSPMGVDVITEKFIFDMPPFLGDALMGKINKLNASLGKKRAKKFKFS